ncbi:MAG TPA: hypothetical protein VF765_16730 [Polyangiaceae bacterium]
MKRLVVAMPILAAWVFACSSGSGSGDTSSASGFGQQFCQLLTPCCADAGLSTSGTVCQAFVSEAASKGSYDPSAGQACINALQGASKSATFCTDFGGNIPQCNDVFGPGSNGAGPGQSCNTSSDCTKAPGGSAICYSQTNFVDGGTTSTSTCVQTQKGTAGQAPCVGTVQGNTTYFAFGSGTPPKMGYTCDVADGVYCDANTQKCTALGATGQTCNGDEQCVTSDYCAFGGTNGSTCQPRIPVGSACTGNGTNECAPSSYCDSASGTCKAQLASGAACTTSQECQSSICNNGKCSGSNDLGLALLCGG